MATGYNQAIGYNFAAFYNGGGAQETQETGGHPYSYQPQYAQIKKQKTELQKVDSVLAEFERKQTVAAQSLALTVNVNRQAQLLAIQNDLINEINRLLVVKAEMMARVRRDEEMLILMAFSRRRLRAI